MGSSLQGTFLRKLSLHYGGRQAGFQIEDRRSSALKRSCKRVLERLMCSMAEGEVAVGWLRGFVHLRRMIRLLWPV
jgi:hypothetical protein